MDTKQIQGRGSLIRLRVASLFFATDFTKDEPDCRVTGRTVWRVILLSLLGFVFSARHGAWSAYPFGLALLAAANRQFPFVFAAVCLGALRLPVGGWVYIVAYFLAAGLRLLFSFSRREGRLLPSSPGLFREAPPLRISAALVASFGLSVYELAVGGVGLLSVLYAVSMPVFSCFFCGLLLPYFESGLDLTALVVPTQKKEIPGRLASSSPFWLELSVLALLFVTALGLSDYEYFGISVGLVFATATALVCGRRFGTLRGPALALAVSVGGGLDNPAMIPGIVLAGLVSGLFRRAGVWISAISGAVATTLLLYYAAGLEGLIGGLPEVGVALAVALPIMRLSPLWGEEAAAEDGRSETERRPRRSSSAEGGRMMALADSFSSLAQVFKSISDTMKRPELAGGSRVSAAVAEKYCSICPHKDRCAGETAESLRETAERLASGLDGGSASDRFAVLLPDDCPSLGKIVTEAEEALAACVENRRRSRAGERFALEYEGVAGLLTEAAEIDRVENREDVKLGLRLRDALRAEGIITGRVAVYGERRKYITAGGIHWEGRRSSAQQLRASFEEVCGCRLSNPGWEIEGESITLEMSSVRALSARLYTASRSREADDGDTISSFENREDYFYALLSDGMGSGRDAAYASGICSVFLERMLAAGNSKSGSLKLLNDLMRNKGSEASATIDLFELDLLRSRACFIKSGAAPSYVRRGKDLFRIRSKTVPIGILRALDAEQTAFDVQPGDLVILLSDGITSTPEEAPWLLELLGGELPGEPQAIADRVLAAAVEQTSGEDDMTVGVVEIRAYEEGGSEVA